MLVPVQIGPDGGIAVEIFATAHIPQHCAPARNDDDRLAFEPVAHLCEWMPDEGVVEFGKFVHRGSRAQGASFRGERELTSWLTSAAECAALRVKRNRPCPRATVG